MGESVRGGCLKLGVLAGEELVSLLVLGHGVGNNILWQHDALALVESNGLEVVAKVLLVKATQRRIETNTRLEYKE
jgi:hypothetical protein